MCEGVRKDLQRVCEQFSLDMISLGMSAYNRSGTVVLYAFFILFEGFPILFPRVRMVTVFRQILLSLRPA